ncbi:MAG: ATP-binding protein [Candidatus Latescibacterota bacterium]|nr:MAG: ATP-binding protein [Candidatus Latescibacterota bacterium]
MKTIVSSRKRLALLSGFLLAFIIVLNVSTYVLYQRAKVHLDNELGERLRAIATTLAHAVEFTGSEELSMEDLDPSFLTLLHMVKTENLLSNVVVLTADGKTVVDLGNLSEPGELNPFIELDYTAVTLARSGLSAYTSLYRSGDIYMKSAYAPISSLDNRVIGMIGVEAGAEFFEVLRALSNAIIMVVVTSVVIVIILAGFFYRQSLSLDKAQAAVIQGENLATMGRMVAGIAHEIRNPLSIIKTSAERLSKKYKSDDEAFAYISEEVDQLNRILTGYLNFAKAEPSEFRPHSFQKIVGRCLLILEGELQAKGIKIVKRDPETDVFVLGDDKRIQQAVLNVLLNACQATDPGGRIEVSLESDTKSAIVSVSDNGKGMDDKELKETIKPFFTTKKHGSGLGLSIVNNIIEEHNGTLEIESEPGEGTVVRITFPRTAKTQKSPG